VAIPAGALFLTVNVIDNGLFTPTLREYSFGAWSKRKSLTGLLSLSSTRGDGTSFTVIDTVPVFVLPSFEITY
jgi:hypothetical protein